MARRFDALLFDLDGTLIHSMPLHHAAWARWFAMQGLPFDEAGFFEATAGRTNAEILAGLFPARSAAEHHAMGEAKEALYRERARAELTEVAGALAFLDQARAAGLQLAVCTASPPGNLAVAFERFALAERVHTVTSPADGLRGKPHPDIFAEAARRLGVAPARCLVFEDAPLGLQAAHNAGMAAVALCTSVAAEAFAPFPNLLHAVPDFTALHLPTLIASQEVTQHAA